jgi:hypothetical protein
MTAPVWMRVSADRDRSDRTIMITDIGHRDHRDRTIMITDIGDVIA